MDLLAEPTGIEPVLVAWQATVLTIERRLHWLSPKDLHPESPPLKGRRFEIKLEEKTFDDKEL